MKKNDPTSNSTAISNQNLEQQTNHAIIILASGLSRRLGQAKQLLCKNGMPLISHMLQLAISTNPQAIIVVLPHASSLTKSHSDIADTLQSAIAALAVQHRNIHIVINPTPERGMAHSLSLGISALRAFDKLDFDNCSSSHVSFNNDSFATTLLNRVLIMGIDQVLLDKQHLMALLAGSHTVVASSYVSEVDWQYLDNTTQILDKMEFAKPSQKNIIGMPLIIHYALLKYWQTQLVGDEGLRHLIRGLSSEQMQIVINPQLSYDIDTPEQLIYAQKRGWLDKQY